MLRRTLTPRAPYALFRYLESDWRNPIDRDKDADTSKYVLQYVQNNTIPPNAVNPADLTTETYAHRMLFSFTKAGLGDDVSAALRYIRGHTNLEAFHFNQLLRCLAHAREKQACLNVLQLMAEKGEVDDEAVSIVVTALHTWSGKNRMQSILALLRKVYLPVDSNNSSSDVKNNNTNNNSEEKSGTQPSSPSLIEPLPLSSPWTVRTAWELALWPRPKRNSDQQPDALPRRPRDLPEFSNSPAAAEQAKLEVNGWSRTRKADLKRETHRESQTLSALLNAVSNGPEGALASLVVVAWIKAAEAELSSFDYFHVLSAIARDLNQFRDVQAVFCDNNDSNSSSSSYIPEGCVTLADIAKSTAKMIRDHNELNNNNSNMNRNAATIPAPYWLRSASAIAKLAVEVMEEHRPGSSSAPVYVGFLNKRARSAEQMISHVFDELHRRNTVGATGESPEHVHHAYALALMTLRRDTLAVQELANLHNRLQKRLQEQQLQQQKKKGDETSKKPGRRRSLFLATAAASSALATTSNSNRSPLALFEKTAPSLFPGNDGPIPKLHLWFPRDVAFRFVAVPRPVLDKIKPAYERLCELGAPQAEEVDQWMNYALGLQLLNSREQVVRAVELVRESVRRRDGEKSIRQQVRCLLQYFASVPPPPLLAKNSNSSNNSSSAELLPPRVRARVDNYIAERKKWGSYFEARDVSLAFFGHTKAARDMMRRVFSDGGRMPAVRSPDVVESDAADVHELFSLNSTSSSINDNNATATTASAHAIPRLTETSVFGKLPTVPEHLDPTTPAAKETPIPILPLSGPMIVSNNDRNNKLSIASNTQKDQQQHNHSEEEEDLFWRLHSELRSQQDFWWFSEVEPSFNYLRCLLHRLDWQAASEAATQIVVKQGYQAALDAEVHRIFEEIGDPGGAMCFKFATKLIDGRILEENRDPTKRRRRPQIFGAPVADEKQGGSELAKAFNAAGVKTQPPPLETRDRDGSLDAGAGDSSGVQQQDL